MRTSQHSHPARRASVDREREQAANFDVEWSKNLPALPVISDLMRGPTGYSNWVIQGRLMAGAYPASMNDYEHQNTILSILRKGICTFVCLQAEAEQYCPESRWRKGQGIRTYLQDARELLKRDRHQLSQRKVDWVHFKIRDGFIGPDEGVLALVEHLCARFLRGDVLYVHCWGGHGRTGTIVSLMLVYLYGMPAEEAMRIVQRTHDRRKNPQNMRSPESPAQVAQVRRLATQLLSVRASAPPALRPGAGHFVVDNFSIAEEPPAPALSPAVLGVDSPQRDSIRTPHSMALTALAAALPATASGRHASPAARSPAARSPIGSAVASLASQQRPQSPVLTPPPPPGPGTPTLAPALSPPGRGHARPRTQDGSGALAVPGPSGSGRTQLHLPSASVTASAADPLARSAPARLSPPAHAARPALRPVDGLPPPSRLPLASGALRPSLTASAGAHAGSPRLAPPGPAGGSPASRASPSLAPVSKSSPSTPSPKLAATPGPKLERATPTSLAASRKLWP